MLMYKKENLRMGYIKLGGHRHLCTVDFTWNARGLRAGSV
jgi:hypothetical protein